MNHIDNGGKLCHGQGIDDFVGIKAYHVAHINKELYQWVD
jgi:hypothetical protein